MEHVLQFREPKKRLIAIDTVPSNMSSAYGDIIKRIETSRPGDKELATRIFSWICRSMRPLSMEELLEALVVEELEADLTLEGVLQDKLSPADVIECCKSLVIHEKSSGLVRFTHFTVQEYIESNAQEILPMETHLAKTCLAYLAFPEFDELKSRSELRHLLSKYRFGRYVGMFWDDHTRGEAESSLDVQRAFVYVFGRQRKAASVLQLGRLRYWKTPPEYPILLTICRYGLATICHVALNGGLKNMYSPRFRMILTASISALPEFLRPSEKFDISLTSISGSTALHISAQRGDQNIVEILLAAGADVGLRGEDGWTPLHYAAARGHHKIVKKFLTARADLINIQTKKEMYTALHAAVGDHQEHIKVVELLLSTGADLSVQDWLGGTALQLATSNIHEKIVKMLLAAGADVRIQDQDGMTALHQSIWTGNAKLVNTLLAVGADISVQDRKGRTVLHYALQTSNYYELSKLPLAAGVDISVRDQDGRTALYQAVSLNGRILEEPPLPGADVSVQCLRGRTLVEMLLTAGADVHVPDQKGWTVLHVAVRYDDCGLVEVLLSAGADVNAEGEDGETPLSMAISRGNEKLVHLLKAHLTLTFEELRKYEEELMVYA